MTDACPARTVCSVLRYFRSMGVREAAVADGGGAAEEERERRLRLLRASAGKAACPSCPVGKVPPVRLEGDPCATLAFVVDSPGPDGDILPGEEGELFGRMLGKMGLTREGVYVTAAVLCPVPGGGPPPAAAIAACRERLASELEAVAPSAICPMGSLAASALLGGDEPLARLRGRRHDWRGRAVFPTLPPRIMLQNVPARKDAWQDMLAVLEFLGKKPGEQPPCRN